MLLEAGGSPEFVDKVSMESAFDVAQNEEVRAVLVSCGFICLLLSFGRYFLLIVRRKCGRSSFVVPLVATYIRCCCCVYPECLGHQYNGAADGAATKGYSREPR